MQIQKKVCNSSGDNELKKEICSECLEITMQRRCIIKWICNIPLLRVKQGCSSNHEFYLQVECIMMCSGRSFAETVRCIMQTVFSNELATKFNLTGKGRSGKKGFHFLHLY